jgi:hypothetical protein
MTKGVRCFHHALVSGIDETAGPSTPLVSLEGESHTELNSPGDLRSKSRTQRR